MLRPRFQFRLRTLFGVVTPVAVGCGYVGSQTKIVQQRQQWLATHRQEPLANMSWSIELVGEADASQSPWIIRRWLGDVQPGNVYATNQDEFEQACELFPEAEVDEVHSVKIEWEN